MTKLATCTCTVRGSSLHNSDEAARPPIHFAFATSQRKAIGTTFARARPRRKAARNRVAAQAALMHRPVFMSPARATIARGDEHKVANGTASGAHPHNRRLFRAKSGEVWFLQRFPCVARISPPPLRPTWRLAVLLATRTHRPQQQLVWHLPPQSLPLAVGTKALRQPRLRRKHRQLPTHLLNPRARPLGQPRQCRQ